MYFQYLLALAWGVERDFMPSWTKHLIKLVTLRKGLFPSIPFGQVGSYVRFEIFPRSNDRIACFLHVSLFPLSRPFSLLLSEFILPLVFNFTVCILLLSYRFDATQKNHLGQAKQSVIERICNLGLLREYMALHAVGEHSLRGSVAAVRLMIRDVSLLFRIVNRADK